MQVNLYLANFTSLLTKPGNNYKTMKTAKYINLFYLPDITSIVLLVAPVPITLQILKISSH